LQHARLQLNAALWHADHYVTERPAADVCQREIPLSANDPNLR
jgi:hypothetical protein